LRPSGNTPPSNYTKLDELLLSAGIDSAYIGYYGTIKKQLLNAIYAGEKVVRVGEFELKVGTTKTGTYSFSLDNECLHILLGNTAAAASPPVMVQMKSVLIWSRGFPQAYTELLNLMTDLFHYGIEGEKVSRVDLCADFDWQEGFTDDDCAKFITRAAISTQHRYGLVTGFEIGKGKFRAIIYDKSLEIRKSNKRWFYELWGGEYQNVWRVEFQFRRELLKRLKIETVQDLVINCQALWNLASEKRLTMREGETSNVTRRPLTKFWVWVQSVKISFNIPIERCESIKSAKSSFEKKQAVSIVAGITRRYANDNGIHNPQMALDDLLPSVRAKLTK
jgi:hypothetical protein